MKDIRRSILLDKERYLLFDLNAMEDLCVRYRVHDAEEIENDISYLITKMADVVGEGFKFNEVKYILTLLINENIRHENSMTGADDPVLSEEEVGRMINGIEKVKEAADVIAGTVLDSIGKSEADGLKNEKTTQSTE